MDMLTVMGRLGNDFPTLEITGVSNDNNEFYGISIAPGDLVIMVRKAVDVIVEELQENLAVGKKEVEELIYQGIRLEIEEYLNLEHNAVER